MPSKERKKKGLFYKVGDTILSADKLPGKVKTKVKIRKKAAPKAPEIPKALKNYFERRNAGWPEYVMLKIQVAILILFFSIVIYIVVLPLETLIFIPLLIALSGYMLYLAPTELKRAFERDYSAYRNFVIMTVAIAWVFTIALRHSPIRFSSLEPNLAIIPPLFAIFFVLVSFTAFRFKYGRNFTYGSVEQVRDNRAVVRIGYDIRSNVKVGLYPVESFVKVKRGDIVKLSVERGLFGLRGSKIRAIISKANPK